MLKGLRCCVLLLVCCAALAQQKRDERINVFFTSDCSRKSTGAIVESSFRENVRASAGYRLVERQEAGTFVVSVTCVDAGEVNEGWIAVAYMYGLAMTATPEDLGISIWNPTLGVFTVGRTHAESKGQELFARFDNALHHH